MKGFIYLIISFIVIQSAFADVNVRLEFSQDTISTGELTTVQMIVDPAAVQAVSFQSMKGQTLSDKIYIQSVGPLLRHEGSQDFTAEAEVVLIRGPEGNEIKAEFNGQPVKFFWNNVHINVLEAPADYILGEFTVPTPRNILLWFLIALAIVLLFYGLWVLRNKLHAKTKKQNELKKTRDLVISCHQYSEVVELWKQKKKVVGQFPHLEEPLTRFEQVLFQVQFKPTQTEAEKERVMQAYRQFVKDTEEGFRGI